MIDKELESEYLHQADEHIGSLVDHEEVAKFIGWVGYGLDLREAEVQALKDRITELEG